MKYLFLIPARGGSKGIPGKNVKKFAGKPLIARTVEQAVEVACDVADVVVSTDSEEIAAAAAEAGAPVPFMRPAELAGDRTPTRDVIIHALEWLASHGRRYDGVVLLQTTSPLRRVEDIRNAIRIFEDNPRADMAVSVCEASANPYYDAFETDPSGSLRICKGSGEFTRRQDAPVVWQYNGAVYVMKPQSIIDMPMSRFPSIVPSPMPRELSVDLDTPLDWIVAETIFQNL